MNTAFSIQSGPIPANAVYKTTDFSYSNVCTDIRYYIELMIFSHVFWKNTQLVSVSGKKACPIDRVTIGRTLPS